MSGYRGLGMGAERARARVEGLIASCGTFSC